MSESSKGIWFQLGYALESASQRAHAPRKVGENASAPVEKVETSAVDHLLAAGTGAVAHRLVGALSGRRPGSLRLAHAAAAGAGAAFALSLLRGTGHGASNGTARSTDPAGELLMGAGRGILYSMIVEPRLPGSPFLRGATFGVIEYVASPFGGLDGILGASSPRRTVPLLSALLGTDEAPMGSLSDHVAFGVALGLLYGDGRARRGKRAAE